MTILPACTLAAALVGAASVDAVAETLDWNGTGPHWNAVGAWTPEGPPGPEDVARFALDRTDEARFFPDAIRVVEQLVVAQERFRLRFFAGAPLNGLYATAVSPSAPGLLVGVDAGHPPATLACTANEVQPLTSITSEHLALGWNVGSQGTLEREALAFLDLRIPGTAIVGRLGIGAIELDGSGVFDVGTMLLGWGMSGSGTMRLGEATEASILSCSIGRLGSGAVTIETGAALRCDGLTLAGAASAEGSLDLDGPGANLLVLGPCELGWAGAAAVALNPYTSATSWSTAIIGGIPGGTGALTIQGPEARWHAADDLWLSFAGDAEVTIASGGRLQVDGDLLVGVGTAHVTARLGDPRDAPGPLLVVAGEAEAFPLEVVFDAAPVAGDRFTLLRALGGHAVTVAIPDPPALLRFRLEDDGETIVLAIDPIGDVNGDGDADLADLLALLAAWGRCDGCPEDLDGDGAVGFPDLLLLLGSWTG